MMRSVPRYKKIKKSPNALHSLSERTACVSVCVCVTMAIVGLNFVFPRCDLHNLILSSFLSMSKYNDRQENVSRETAD